MPSAYLGQFLGASCPFWKPPGCFLPVLGSSWVPPVYCGCLLGASCLSWDPPGCFLDASYLSWVVPECLVLALGVSCLPLGGSWVPPGGSLPALGARWPPPEPVRRTYSVPSLRGGGVDRRQGNGKRGETRPALNEKEATEKKNKIK